MLSRSCNLVILVASFRLSSMPIYFWYLIWITQLTRFLVAPQHVIRRPHQVHPHYKPCHTQEGQVPVIHHPPVVPRLAIIKLRQVGFELVLGASEVVHAVAEAHLVGWPTDVVTGGGQAEAAVDELVVEAVRAAGEMLEGNGDAQV